MVQRPGREGRAKTLPLKSGAVASCMAVSLLTPEGKARVIAAHTKHGRQSNAHVVWVKAINAELRRITYELKRGGWIP